MPLGPVGTGTSLSLSSARGSSTSRGRDRQDGIELKHRQLYSSVGVIVVATPLHTQTQTQALGRDGLVQPPAFAWALAAAAAGPATTHTRGVLRIGRRIRTGTGIGISGGGGQCVQISRLCRPPASVNVPWSKVLVLAEVGGSMRVHDTHATARMAVVLRR